MLQFNQFPEYIRDSVSRSCFDRAFGAIAPKRRTLISTCVQFRVAGRGDPPLTDTKVQMGKIVSVQMTREMTKHGGLRPVVSVEKMQIRLKMLEDSNAALNLRNRSLIAGNKNLTKRYGTRVEDSLRAR